MNLKEAFRFQNKLQSMMDEAKSILSRDQNITKVQNTFLRKEKTYVPIRSNSRSNDLHYALER